MSEDILIAGLVIFSGLFSILGSILNWNFFFNSRKARFFVKTLGRSAARIFYIILGIFLVGIGMTFLF